MNVLSPNRSSLVELPCVSNYRAFTDNDHAVWTSIHFDVQYLHQDSGIQFKFICKININFTIQDRRVVN